ncbi:MAG: response regulator [Cyclobacteriaceae bacterium]|nr:response regulator [Cyclobacteriaceae bacterium]
MKILIIDDSTFQRNLIKNCINKSENEIIEAGDGEEGLEMIEKHNPDCVISDILMPKIDGFAFLKILHEKNHPVPVIIVSSNIQSPAKNLCLMYGAKFFLNKPIDKEKLVEALNNISKKEG